MINLENAQRYIVVDKTYPRKKVNLVWIGYWIFVLFAVGIGFYFDYQDCLEGITC